MGEGSNIEWTDHSWNPVIGCSHVSPGCAHCYAESYVKRLGGNFFEVRKAAPSTWQLPYRLARSRETRRRLLLGLPPQHVFTCSLSDFFHPAADPWRPAMWTTIRETPELTYQILTKRPERIRDNLPDGWHQLRGWANVWLGTSIESSEYAERARILLESPAPVHFLSCEPLLGPIGDIREVLGPDLINWVIVGGESGIHARTMKEEWVTSIRDQCLDARVPFFFKQWGSRSRDKGGHEKAVLEGRRWTEMPDGPRTPVQHTLDEVEHEVPVRLK
jgi:protein gp37